jgi:ABC-type polysaccharide/polyol phosphate export permease
MNKIGNVKMGVAKLHGLVSNLGKVPEIDAPLPEETKQIKTTAPTGNLRNATKDLGRALKAWRIWILLGANDIRQRYRRSTLGQFWITGSIVLMVTGLGIIYSSIFHQPIGEYLPYVAAGFVVWFLITGMINDGCTTFLESEKYAKQLTVPLSVYPLRTLSRNLFIFAHNVIILPFIWLIFLVPVGWSYLLVIPGLLLVALNGFWMILLLGTLCTRFRDLPQIVSSSMQVAFFVTPVMFRSDQLRDSWGGALGLNPFAALLAVAREPLLGRVPSTLDYALAIGVLLFGWATALLVYGRYRTRITYWL